MPDRELPDFIIAGTQKAGTSSLWAYMSEHPDICMARIKEPTFFTRSTVSRQDDEYAPRLQGHFDWGWEWYTKLYEACAPGSIRGEASARYMSAEDAPALMSSRAPGVRIIFVLRHPVDRIQAHYDQDRGLYRIPSLDELMRSNHPHYELYLRVSRYGEQLARFLERFPREQIRVYLTEELSSPQDVVRDAYAFVGADPSFVPSSIGRRYNVAAAPRSRVLHRVLTAGYGRRLLPVPIESFGRRVKSALRSWNLGPPTERELSPDVREDILDRLSDDVDLLESLLGRSLDRWQS